MRTFAVSLVLFDHVNLALGRYTFGTWNTAWVGVFGVYLFFVHTCLVLMWSLERQPHTLNFYIRRAFRIYPLAIAAILVALLTGIPVDSSSSSWVAQHFSIKAIVANLLLIQDLVHGPNIAGVMWSLTIEVQMYLLLPALFFYASRERRLWQILVLWLLAVAVLVAYLPLGGNNLLTVIPDFLPGVIAYLAFRSFRSRLPSWTFLPYLLVLLSLFMVRPSPPQSWPLMLALGITLPFFRQITNPGSIWLSKTIAKYSYGIYLWHTFGLKICFHYFANQPSWIRVMCALLITAVASFLSYHAIEEPLIRVGSRLARANDRREAAARQPATPAVISVP